MKAYAFGASLAMLLVSADAGDNSTQRSLLRKKPARALMRLLPAYPLGRFQEWSSLTEMTQRGVSGVLGYTEKSWNLPGKNPIELLSFETLGYQVEVEKNNLAPSETIGAIMTFTNITDEDVWDCHVNHYSDYSWDEMIEFSLASYAEDLGWTRDTYDNYENGAKPPSSDDKEWFELTEIERMAAEALCYFPELWAGDVEIGDWEYQPPEIVTGNATLELSNITVMARPKIFPWTLPLVRFTVWDQLSPVQQGYATTTGFNESTWNNPGTAVMVTSYMDFGDLTPAQQSSSESLGIDEFFWDCLIQHYGNHGWNQLQVIGVKGYLETLGWNFASWHGVNPPPPTESMLYASLTPEQQLAADQLCYLPETYNAGSQLSTINLQSLTAPPSAAPSMSPSVP